jgi:hypothetical protein
VIVKKIIKRFGNILIVFFIMILLVISGLMLVNPGKKAQLSIYSDDWHDISDFRADLEALDYTISHVSSSPIYLRQIEKPEKSVFIVAGLEREYNILEIEAISNYIYEGGSVILADDFGYGNSLMENIYIKTGDFTSSGTNNYKLGYKFLENQVVDIEYEKDPNYVKVTTDTYFQYELLLNAPSGFIENEDIGYYEPDYIENVEVLAQSSSLSWVDLNSNYSRDIGETSGPFPLILRVNWLPEFDIDSPFQTGIPSLLLISDPSILINEMWDKADNREFILNHIYKILPNGGKIIFDESVHINENIITEMANSYYVIFIYIFSHPAIFILIEFLLFILLLFLTFRTRPIIYHRHKDKLDNKMLYMMLRPDMDITDYFWVRGIMLDKIRVGYKIPQNIFHYYSQDQIRVLVDDDEISDFLFGNPEKRGVPRFMMIDEAIVNKIISWKPKSVIFEEITSSNYYSQKKKNENVNTQDLQNGLEHDQK